jgi:archaellum biogenesis ATPase FlaH
MKYFRTNFAWLDHLMPEGIPIPSSTMISGPGGSGKPLIGLAIAASWLLQGGKVIFVPLQYPERIFTEKDLEQLYDIRLSNYVSAFFFVKFDLALDLSPDAIERLSPDEIRANLIHPETWARALDLADQALGPSNLGTLVFGSALNLLLFSPTYGNQMRSHLEVMLREDKRRTYLFTVSSSALEEEIVTLEQAADNLLFTQMSHPERKLQLQVMRLKGASHLDEIGVAPFNQETLEAIKKRADASRVAQIPAIRKI